MKTYLLLIFLGIASAQRRNFFRNFANKPLSRNEVSTQKAPYDPAGFKPEKEFNLPSKSNLPAPELPAPVPPSTSYGVPAVTGKIKYISYLPPRQYGLPAPSPSPPADDYEELEASVEQPGNPGDLQSAYYILLPNGKLSKLQIISDNALNSKLEASGPAALTPAAPTPAAVYGVPDASARVLRLS